MGDQAGIGRSRDAGEGALIIPCIDLQGGQVVQLVRGEELALQRSLEEALELMIGFRRIHVIDLDAAKGESSNAELIEVLLNQLDCEVRVGGGIRSVAHAQSLMDAGAHQVIVGSAAFVGNEPNWDLLMEMAETIGRERIVVAIDTRGGKVTTGGWRKSLEITPKEAAIALKPYAGALMCTYVDSEGTMQGTDLALFRELRDAVGCPLIAAGGIGKENEVDVLLEIGCEVALGMSLYTGRISLEWARGRNSRFGEEKIWWRLGDSNP